MPFRVISDFVIAAIFLRDMTFWALLSLSTNIIDLVKKNNTKENIDLLIRQSFINEIKYINVNLVYCHLFELILIFPLSFNGDVQ